TQSAYVQFNQRAELAGRPVNIITGMRYESTEVTSTSATPTYDEVRWVADNEMYLRTSGVQEYVTGTGKYSHLLPSLDVDIEVVDDVVLRGSVSKTIARPSYNDIQSGASLNGQARVNGGQARSEERRVGKECRARG